jgi:hypothetical protein
VRLRRSVVLGLLALVIVAVPIGIYAAHAKGPLSVATAPGSGSSPSARLAGQFGGKQNSDGSACFWIDTPGARGYVQWPRGWSAAPNPLRLLDDWGHTVAKPGDRLSLGGGGDDSRTVAHCPAPQGTTHSFFAGTVAQAPPS